VLGYVCTEFKLIPKYQTKRGIMNCWSMFFPYVSLS